MRASSIQYVCTVEIGELVYEPSFRLFTNSYTNHVFSNDDKEIFLIMSPHSTLGSEHSCVRDDPHCLGP